MGKWVVRLALLFVLATVVSGCSFFGAIEWEWEGPHNQVSGKVTLRDLGVPLINARVFFNGPIDRSAVTGRTGLYSTSLPNGNYHVTVRTLHDDYKAQANVRSSGTLNLNVSAGAWFDKYKFYGLAGIRRYYFDDYGLTYDDWGEMARWEQSSVRVFFDTFNAPWGASTWADKYWTHILSTWRSLLDETIAFERVSSPGSADVEVQWVPAGSLSTGSHTQAATKTAFYWEDGSLRKVRIKIDERYAMDPGLWEHEWARAMGISYTNDASSVMYPAIQPNQRTQLSSLEKRYVQLIYNLPSGLTMAQVFGMAAQDGGDSGADGEPPALQESAGYGYAGHMRTIDGRVIPLEQVEAEEIVLGW